MCAAVLMLLSPLVMRRRLGHEIIEKLEAAVTRGLVIEKLSTKSYLGGLHET